MLEADARTLAMRAGYSTDAVLAALDDQPDRTTADEKPNTCEVGR